MLSRIYVTIFASLVMMGCALTEDAVEIKYLAPANISVVPGAEHVVVSVSALDGRVSNRDRISTKKNGYGMEMAKIIASNDIISEVGQAVQTELASLGFKIGQGGMDVVLQLQIFIAILSQDSGRLRLLRKWLLICQQRNLGVN